MPLIACFALHTHPNRGALTRDIKHIGSIGAEEGGESGETTVN